MRPSHRLIVMLLLAAGLPAVAAAQAGPSDGDITRTCRGDYFRFCTGIAPGEGRIAQCLSRNRASLAPACRVALDAASGCRPEIETLCRASTSPQALRACLAANAAKLSAECRKGLGTF